MPRYIWPGVWSGHFFLDMISECWLTWDSVLVSGYYWSPRAMCILPVYCVSHMVRIYVSCSLLYVHGFLVLFSFTKHTTWANFSSLCVLSIVLFCFALTKWFGVFALMMVNLLSHWDSFNITYAPFPPNKFILYLLITTLCIVNLQGAK